MFEDTKESNPLKQNENKPINGTGEAKKKIKSKLAQTTKALS